MTLFAPGNRSRTPRHERLYAAYELAFTIVDFTAALCFVIGSVMFYYESLMIPGTTLFLIGSLCFALKPTIRLVREIHYLRLGKIDKLAQNC